MALQYRAFELYGWYPEEVTRPVKPDFYPSKWREPQPDTVKVREPRMASAPSRSTSRQPTHENHRELRDRIVNWSHKPALNVHKIIALVVQSPDGISRSNLVKQVARYTQSRNPDGAVASLLTNSGNAYGRVFNMNDERVITLHPKIEKEVRALTWNVD